MKRKNIFLYDKIKIRIVVTILAEIQKEFNLHFKFKFCCIHKFEFNFVASVTSGEKMCSPTVVTYDSQVQKEEKKFINL